LVIICKIVPNNAGEEMRVKQLGHFNIVGSKELIDQVSAFYREVFGFKAGSRPGFDIPGAWLYRDKEPLVHLTILAGKGDIPRAGAATGCLHHIAFDCEGLEGFKNKMRDCGIDYKVALVPELTMTQLFIHDPAGICLELNFREME
jgi:catechol 2,3-dioxygenase-like lactoylglutathione lyase family enzyme